MSSKLLICYCLLVACKVDAFRTFELQEKKIIIRKMSTKMLYGCLFLLVILTAHSWACNKRDPDDGKPSGGDVKPTTDPGSGSSGATVNACCHCGQAISVSVLVSNQIQEPFFEYRTEVKERPQRELIHLLEDASTQDMRFRFHAQHYGSMGYAITTINDLAASAVNKTYWMISSHPEGFDAPRSLPLGVSSYIPAHKEVVMFNLTSYATPNNH
ncbi:hypothetical protein EGW08_000686 [Elysia chlorotica]|uniref:DUF4430 domain-containing protein n=1 Tax=Elysia chlorotica TaxID=188477 RepID=A0A433UCJ0_ELYCH|nr:hypothetical protein EGW08_000686 [Elysia chlorotica]